MSELRKKALDYLSRREHSREELKRKLNDKASQAELDSLLGELVSQGLQSDERFAESYVRSRVNSGIGPLRIAQELNQRGVGAELISRSLAEDDDFWWENLQAAWQKKYHDTDAPVEQKEYGRRVRFLSQRGFAPSMVMRLLDLKRR